MSIPLLHRLWDLSSVAQAHKANVLTTYLSLQPSFIKKSSLDLEQTHKGQWEDGAGPEGQESAGPAGEMQVEGEDGAPWRQNRKLRVPLLRMRFPPPLVEFFEITFPLSPSPYLDPSRWWSFSG